jgi:pimeloyl-ACP methyl ester carboxylesterase
MDQPASLSQLAVIDVWWFPDLDQLPLMILGGNPLWHLAFHAIPGLPELLTQGREEGYLRWFFDHGAGAPGSVSPDAVAEYVAAYSQPGTMSSGFDYYRAIAADRDDARARADVRLALPVLAIGGQRSLAEAVGTSLQRIAPAVQTVVISESGHWVPDERPGELADALLRFFADPAAADGDRQPVPESTDPGKPA